MNTEQENNLMKTASRNNIWVLRYPSVKAHLIEFFSDKRGEHFTDADGTTMPNYPAFFADILQAHNDLYVDSLPCIALCKDENLQAHRKAVKHFRTIDSYLKDGGEIHFKLHGWCNGVYEGVNILSIRVENKDKTKGENWDTREMPRLADQLGFDKLRNIVTDISPVDPRYNEIRDVLRRELVELTRGWGNDGNITWMAPIRSFAVRCRGLNETIKEYLPDSTKKQRAEIIMDLFKFYADPSDFAEILDPPQENA